MFKYGKKAGIMSIVLIVLAVVPLITAAIFVPQMSEQVAMRIAQSGEVMRWGSRYEMFVVPVFAVLLGLATYMSAGKQARAHEIDSPAMAVVTAERFLRNGIVTGVVLNLANAYMFYAALTGHGLF